MSRRDWPGYAPDAPPTRDDLIAAAALVAMLAFFLFAPVIFWSPK